jgi:gamma-tubulin complex component 3
MMHFVVNLKSYLFFEVLEAGWKSLSIKLTNGTSLDDFILAHDAYLEDIVQKSLLGSDDMDDAIAEGLSLQLQMLLRLALEFCTFQEELFRTAIRQAERATEKRKEAERRSKLGDWGFASEQDVQEAKTFFGLTDAAKMTQVQGLGREFNEGTHDLLTQLHMISHGRSAGAAGSPTPRSVVSTSESISTSMNRDHFNHDSLHFLMFQLDYSGFYNVGD